VERPEPAHDARDDGHPEQCSRTHRGVEVTYRCTSKVGLPLQSALNHYITAASIWNGCLSKLGCTFHSINAEEQRDWGAATRKISAAEKALQNLLLTGDQPNF
jgi:hypothetical protein